MIIYLSSPRSQLHCSALNEMPVLLSFTNWSPYISSYQASFGRLMIDSGAFSEFTSGQSVDISAYRDWSELWRPQADAIAGLDDIRGDWRKSLANYDAIPWGFPTFHDSDPDELLPDLVALARERGTWVGIGLVPPRHGKEPFLRHALERIPEGLHVHFVRGPRIYRNAAHRFDRFHQLVAGCVQAEDSHRTQPSDPGGMPGNHDQEVPAMEPQTEDGKRKSEPVRLSLKEMDLRRQKAANLDQALEWLKGRTDSEALVKLEAILRQGL
jgi:hypothetical protein